MGTEETNSSSSTSSGGFVLKKDSAKAEQFFLMAALQEHPEAFYFLGEIRKHQAAGAQEDAERTRVSCARLCRHGFLLSSKVVAVLRGRRSYEAIRFFANHLKQQPLLICFVGCLIVLRYFPSVPPRAATGPGHASGLPLLPLICLSGACSSSAGLFISFFLCNFHFSPVVLLPFSFLQSRSVFMEGQLRAATSWPGLERERHWKRKHLNGKNSCIANAHAKQQLLYVTGTEVLTLKDSKLMVKHNGNSREVSQMRFISDGSKLSS